MAILGPHKGVCIFSARDSQPTPEAVIIAHGGWEPADGFTEVPLRTSIYFYQSHWDYGKATDGIALAKGDALAARYTTTDPGKIDPRTYAVTPGATHSHSRVKTVAGPGARINDYELTPHPYVTDDLFQSIFKILIAGGGQGRKDIVFVPESSQRAHFSSIWKALAKFNRNYSKIHSTACRVVPDPSGSGYLAPGK